MALIASSPLPGGQHGGPELSAADMLEGPAHFWKKHGLATGPGGSAKALDEALSLEETLRAVIDLQLLRGAETYDPEWNNWLTELGLAYRSSNIYFEYSGHSLAGGITGRPLAKKFADEYRSSLQSRFVSP